MFVLFRPRDEVVGSYCPLASSRMVRSVDVLACSMHPATSSNDIRGSFVRSSDRRLTQISEQYFRCRRCSGNEARHFAGGTGEARCRPASFPPPNQRPLGGPWKTAVGEDGLASEVERGVVARPVVAMGEVEIEVVFHRGGRKGSGDARFAAPGNL